MWLQLILCTVKATRPLVLELSSHKENRERAKYGISLIVYPQEQQMHLTPCCHNFESKISNKARQPTRDHTPRKYHDENMNHQAKI